jgi:subtilisin family serine protease
MYQRHACRLYHFPVNRMVLSMKPFVTRSRACRALLIAAAIGLGVPAAAKSGDDPEVPGEVLVRLRATADLQPLLQKYSLSLRAQFGARPIYRLSLVGAAATHDVIDALALEPTVLNAEANAIHSAPETRRNTPWAIGTPTAYTAQWAPQALRLPRAHALSRGAGVRVAVLDTGIDQAHPAFAGRLVPGYDFVDGDLDPNEVFAPGSVSFGHGTHVAGLVALAAPAAQIMPLRVLDAQGQGNAWVLAEAMLHAVDPDRNPATNDGAQVINMSLGSTNRTELFNSIAQLSACSLPAPADPENTYTDPGYNADRERCNAFGGAVVIAAAGNDASKDVRQYPAAEGAYGLLPVTASNAQRRLAPFANFGSWVDIAAPGDGITSAMVGGGWATWSGTSMAAPLASGVAALLKASEPGLSAKDVARRLERQSAVLCGTNAQRQIDAEAVLRNAAPADAACP